MRIGSTAFTDAALALFARIIAKMMAGDSIKAIAAAMCPPKGMPD